MIRTPRICFPLLLLAAITAVYWPIFKYPFIQDDWGYLYFIAQNAERGFFAQVSSICCVFFYRPLGVAYLALVHYLFGLVPLGFHTLAFVLHFVTSVLIVHIVQTLLQDEMLSWATGFLYATSVTIHMEPMLWLVGFFWHGSAFFWLVSLALFLARRSTLSALAWFAALLSGESTFFLPLLLLLHALHTEANAKAAIFRLGPHLLAVVLYLALRLKALFPFLYSALKAGVLWSFLGDVLGDPYAVRLAGSHLLENLVLYTMWAIDAVLPFKGTLEGAWRGLAWLNGLPGLSLWFLLAFVLVLVFSLAGFNLGRLRAVIRRHYFLVFFAGWAVLGLIPVFFLRNHSYRYYLTNSLPPVIVMFLLSIRAVVMRFRGQPRHVASAMVILAFAGIVSSAHYFYRRDVEGLDQQFTVGTNSLVKRGTTVRIVRDGLLKAHPSLPKGANVVFSGIDTASFFGFAGPRLWYGDTSLRVYEAGQLSRRLGGLYVEESEENEGEVFPSRKSRQERYLEPEQTFFFGLEDGVLREDEYAAFERMR